MIYNNNDTIFKLHEFFEILPRLKPILQNTIDRDAALIITSMDGKQMLFVMNTDNLVSLLDELG